MISKSRIAKTILGIMATLVCGAIIASANTIVKVEVHHQRLGTVESSIGEMKESMKAIESDVRELLILNGGKPNE